MSDEPERARRRAGIFARHRTEIVTAMISAIFIVPSTLFAVTTEGGISVVSGWFTDDTPGVDIEPRPRELSSAPSSSGSASAGPAASASAAPASAGPDDREAVDTRIYAPDVNEPYTYMFLTPTALDDRAVGELDRLTRVRPEQSRHVTPAADLRDWVLRRGGADAGETQMRLFLTAKDKPFTVIGMRAEVLSRDKPLTGALLISSAQGETQPVPISLNLDGVNPRAAYFDRKTYDVAPKGVAAFDITGSVTRSTVLWRLQVTILLDGERRTIDAGKRFRTTPGIRFATIDGVEHLRPAPGVAVEEIYWYCCGEPWSRTYP